MYKNDAEYEAARQSQERAGQIYDEIVSYGVPALEVLEYAKAKTSVPKEKSAISGMIGAINRNHKELMQPKLVTDADDEAVVYAALKLTPNHEPDREADSKAAKAAIEAAPARFLEPLLVIKGRILPGRATYSASQTIDKLIAGLPIDAIRQPLLDLLETQDEKVLQRVMLLCGQHGLEDAAAKIMPYISDDTHQSLRSSAMHAMGWMSYAPAYDAVLRQTQSSDNLTRDVALKNLPKLGDPRAIDVVL
ncbi:MAG: hypothetical protein AAF125_28160, partial [Chloroflexota bacterium]